MSTLEQRLYPAETGLRQGSRWLVRCSVAREPALSLNLDTNDPLQALVRKAKTGDTRSFEEIYRQTLNRTYALCLRMTANPSQAEELTQEIYVRVWQKIHTFQGTSRFTTWLHRLAVNVVVSEWRSRSRREEREEREPNISQFQHHMSQLDPGLRMDLEVNIAKLPERCRMAFLLHDVEGMEHQEISKITGMAVGTSKAQVHRARKLLREALQS
ncbi:MAG: RNA polymerase sigma factor [Candidatus Hydrogenedentes bacterium]|nr:RNA polymerase sigma factor [Candidatus Hydrogenedentota bacterium]